MTDPVAAVFSAPALVMVLAGGALWGWRSRWSVRAQRFFFSAAVFYLVAGTGVVPLSAGRALAAGYHRVDSFATGDDVAAVVVLGAGTQTAEGWESHLPVPTVTSAARAIEAARVMKLIDAAVVISSGGESDRDSQQTPSAIVMADALVRLGVPLPRIVIEAQSLNTHDQAARVAALLRERGVQHVILVTSDLHMRRAQGAFKSAGWMTTAAPAPYVFGAHRFRDVWVPGFGLGLAAEVAHEFVGIAYYAARGWWRW